MLYGDYVTIVLLCSTCGPSGVKPPLLKRQMYTNHAGGVLPKHLFNKSAIEKFIDVSTYRRGENAWDGFDHVSVA